MMPGKHRRLRNKVSKPTPDFEPFKKEIKMELYEILQQVIPFVLYAVAIKSILGLHFPWERCKCCGKKYGEHKNENF